MNNDFTQAKIPMVLGLQKNEVTVRCHFMAAKEARFFFFKITHITYNEEIIAKNTIN